MALTFQDERVAEVVVADHTVRTRKVGATGGALDVLLVLLLLVAGVRGLGYAWASWRRSGSLVAVNGHGWDRSKMSRFCRFPLLMAGGAIGLLWAGVFLLGS